MLKLISGFKPTVIPKWPFGIIVSMLILFSGLYLSNFQSIHQSPIRSDAKGYYSWLPALFIYQDPSFVALNAQLNGKNNLNFGSTDFLVKIDSIQAVNRYSCGMAAINLPGFLIANLYGKTIGQSQGFELHYHLSWMLTTLLILILGLIYALKLIESKSISIIQSLVILSLFFGTNLFHYYTFDIGYTHAPTIGLLFVFIYHVKKFSSLLSLKSGLVLGCIAGLIVLIRPFNIVLLPLPILILWNWSFWKQLFRQGKAKLILTLISFFLILSIYFLSIYWQTEKFFVYTYGKETFHFDKPHLFSFLFGFEVGFFTYSPVLIVLFILCLYIYVFYKMYSRLILFMFYFVGFAFVLSCWDPWNFGCTLGSRPMIDFLPFIILPVLIYPIALKKVFYFIFIPFLFACIYLLQVFAFQYRNNIWDWCDMNYVKFEKIFLKTNKEYSYFLTPDWDFAQAKGKILHIDSNFSIEKRTGEWLTTIELDTLSSQNFYICELRLDVFQKKKNQALMRIESYADSEYLDFQQKLIKKECDSIGVWQPFNYRFHVRNVKKKWKLVLKLIDGEDIIIKDKGNMKLSSFQSF